MEHYLIAMGVTAGIYAILALGMNVIWGMAGLINLGLVGFFAVGAYTSALLTLKLGWPIGVGIIAAMAMTSLVGVIVALESRGDADELKRFGRMLAMHVAAANPQALDAAGLDADVVRREKEVLADKYKAQGKPANVIDKIVESGLKTFYKEVCLLDQTFIHPPERGVAQAIKEAEGKAGAPIKVTGFVRYAVGEGVEKQGSD